MTARLAQVVYTLTQFPSVGKGVLFKVDGAAADQLRRHGHRARQPQRRADYESVTPPIFVESPAPFDAVSGTLRVSGTADVFEATFRARLVAGSFHKTLTVTATSGSGTQGHVRVQPGAAGRQRERQAHGLGRVGRERRGAAHRHHPARR